MRRLAIFIITFSCFEICFAQNTFKRDLSFGGKNYHLGEQTNGYIFFPSGSFIKLNSLGDTTYYHKYVLNPTWWSNSYHKFDDNSFLITGTVLDTCPNYYLNQSAITITDSNGHILKTKFYKLSLCKTQSVSAGNLNSDKSILIGSRNHQIIGTGGVYKYDGLYYLMLVDSSLDSIRWIKKFSNHWGSPSFGKQLIDRSFIVGINMDTAGACLARLDSMGNVMWCKSYFRPKGMITDAVVDTDGNVMCVGFTDTITWGTGPMPNNFYTKLFLMKVDTAGNVIYCKGYDDVHPFHFYIKNQPLIKKTIDGNFVIGAAKATNQNANPNVSGHAFLIKVDGNGDTLWTNGYGYQNRVTFFSNMLPVSDGGYLLTGDFYGAISWPFGGCYVYKTDSLGYTSCGNLYDPISITTLFPTDSLVVLLSFDDSVTILNANISEFVSPLQSFVDDCIAVGMPQPQQSNGYNIFPNPTKGEIKIEMPSPLKRDSFVTVYNSMGKIVLQHAIKTEKDLQLDLSKYGKGLYLIKVSEGDRESCSKVVVE